MAYAVAADFGGAVGYLKQVDITDPDVLTLIGDILERSTDIIDTYLGFSYAGYTTATVKYVRAGYGPYLSLSPHEQGSVSSVTTMNDVDLGDYWEELDNGSLYAVDANGYEGNWNHGRYKITANWGYGDVPAAVKEVCVELAVNIWRSRASGHFSRVVGVQGGGAVGYEGALTPQQKMILDKVIDNLSRGSVY